MLEAAAGIYVGDNPDLTGSRLHEGTVWDISHKINQAFTSRYGKKNVMSIQNVITIEWKTPDIK